MIKDISKDLVRVGKKVDSFHIYELTKSNPNDMILGEKIRQYIHELEKTR